MSRIEKILIIAAVASTAVLALANRFGDNYFHTLFSLIPPVCVIGLLLHYAGVIRDKMLQLVVALLVVQMAAGLFVIMHFNGLLLLEWVGVVGQGLFAWLYASRAAKSRGTYRSFHFVIAAIIAIQALSVLIPAIRFNQLTPYLTYPLVGLIGTVKMEKSAVSPGLDKLLNVFLVRGILEIIWMSTQWLG